MTQFGFQQQGPAGHQVGQAQWGQQQPPMQPPQSPPQQPAEFFPGGTAPQQGQAPGVFTPPAGGGGYSTRPQQPTRLFSNLQTATPSRGGVFDHGAGRYWQVIRNVRVEQNNSGIPFSAIDKETIRVIDLKPVMYGIHPQGFGEATTHMFSSKHLSAANNWLAFLMCVTGSPIEQCRDVAYTMHLVETGALKNMVVEVDANVILTRGKQQPMTLPSYVRVVPPDEVRATLDDATIARFFPHGSLDQLVQSYCAATGRPPMAPLPQRIGQGQMVSTAPAGMAPAPQPAPAQQWAPQPAPAQQWAPQPAPAPQPWQQPYPAGPGPGQPPQQWAPAPVPVAAPPSGYYPGQQQNWQAPVPAPAPAGPAFQGYMNNPPPPQAAPQQPWQQASASAAPAQGGWNGGAAQPAY